MDNFDHFVGLALNGIMKIFKNMRDFLATQIADILHNYKINLIVLTILYKKILVLVEHLQMTLQGYFQNPYTNY